MNKKFNYTMAWEMILKFVILTSGIISWAVVDMSDLGSVWYLFPAIIIITTFERLFKRILDGYKKECKIKIQNEDCNKSQNIDNWNILEPDDVNCIYNDKVKQDKPMRKFVM